MRASTSIASSVTSCERDVELRLGHAKGNTHRALVPRFRGDVTAKRRREAVRPKERRRKILDLLGELAPPDEHQVRRLALDSADGRRRGGLGRGSGDGLPKARVGRTSGGGESYDCGCNGQRSSHRAPLSWGACDERSSYTGSRARFLAWCWVLRAPSTQHPAPYFESSFLPAFRLSKFMIVLNTRK
jgi:hypothetical protein